MRYLLTIPLILFFIQCSSSPSKRDDHKTHFSYDKQKEWGGTCNVGKKQSPIDVDSKKAQKNKKFSLSFDSKEIQFESIENLGHTIQAKAKTGNNHLDINGVKYDLLQFHVHTPAEHKLNGKLYDMEVHFVHKNVEGGVAVVGVFFEKSDKPNESLSWVWNELSKVPKNMDKTPINVSKKILNILPKDKKVYNYDGSLTTPPCTEGVKWFVMEKTIPQTADNIKKIEALIQKSSRDVQPMQERILQTN